MMVKDRLRDLISLATESFANHQLVLCDRDRWRIARMSRDRIESCYAAEIISLWGMRLYVGGDIDDCIFAYSDNSDPIAKLRWIGKCEDVGHYVCQKAQIGMTDSGKLTLEGRGGARGPSARVVYAWAAVRRLCELLDEIKPVATRIEPGFVGEGRACAWHPWTSSPCHEVDVEVPADAGMVWLVGERHLGKIADTNALGPQLLVNGRVYALDDAMALGLARIKKDKGEDK